MKIAVCLKLVPSTTAVIRIAAGGKSLDLVGVEMVVSPYDEFALEAALQIRTKVSGSEILALTVGGEESCKVLQHAFALEVERGIWINAIGLDAAAAAHCAAAILKPYAPDLVFCGRQAIDDDAWLFPALLGELLDLPHVTTASRFELFNDGKKASCLRRIEGGEEIIEVSLPTVISCDKGLNEPRSPTLKGRLNAKKKPVEIKTPSELGLDASVLSPALNIIQYAPPSSKTPGKIITSPPKEAAAELVRLLRDEAKVI